EDGGEDAVLHLSARPAARRALSAPSGGSEHQAEGRRTAEGWSREAGCGEAAQSERGGSHHLPVNVGGRFARNAVMPSTKSAVPAQAAKLAASALSCSGSVRPSDSRTSRFALRSAST